mgnify:CR=1 FL=1
MLIDFHTHVFLDKLAPGAVSSLAERAHFKPYANGTVAATRALMHEQGVDRFVALNIAVSPHSERHVNDFAISLLQYPDIIPFGSVHPDSENALSELERLKGAGIKGIKFHNEYQNFQVDDERAFPIYEACEKYGLIMLFHAGADRGFAPPVKTPPEGLRRVWEHFPQSKIVAAHLGGQDMTDRALSALADTGVYIDISFAASSVPAEQGEKVIRAFQNRVLFGSDCPWDTPARTLSYLSQMHFTEKEKEDICFRNALTLLGE